MTKPRRKQPQKPPEPALCPHCGGAKHEGYVLIGGRKVDTPLEQIAEIDSEAAVYFDRDICLPGLVADLCGPRFRMINVQGLTAHYGGLNTRYVVFNWKPKDARWKCIIDTANQIPVETTVETT